MKRLILRGLVSFTLLIALFRQIDSGAVAARLAEFTPIWAVAALAVSVIQVTISAWRWRFTATRLGLAMPLNVAVREYYLATFLNQVLPGGVLGDAARAWRHGRSGAGLGPAVRAVVLERASGQAVMAIVAVLGLLTAPALLPTLMQGISPPSALGLTGVAVALAVAGGLALRTRHLGRNVRRLATDSRVALLAADAWPWQLVASTAVVSSYIAIFILGAHAIGLAPPLTRWLPLIPVLLLAMLIPISFAGWGLRETAAALIWTAAGLDPEDAVAASVAYGLLVLVSSLPGALLLWSRHRSRGGAG